MGARQLLSAAQLLLSTKARNLWWLTNVRIIMNDSGATEPAGHEPIRGTSYPASPSAFQKLPQKTVSSLRKYVAERTGLC